MNIRCPCCGAVNSLDALLAHDDARAALDRLADLGGELTRLLVRYCGLFRPEKSVLSMPRLAKLLTELQAGIDARRIERGGKTCDAPPEAWLWALQQVLEARDSGRLVPPLKNHGYLYTVLANWQPEAAVSSGGNTVRVMESAPSKTRGGLASLNEMKR